MSNEKVDRILSDFYSCDVFSGAKVMTAIGEVRSLVGSDPSEWWLPDRNGDGVCIGDIIENVSSFTRYKVSGFCKVHGKDSFVTSDRGYVYTELARKVIPTPREQIVLDTIDDIHEWIATDPDNDVPLKRILDEAVDRVIRSVKE